MSIGNLWKVVKSTLRFFDLSVTPSFTFCVHPWEESALRWGAWMRNFFGLLFTVLVEHCGWNIGGSRGEVIGTQWGLVAIFCRFLVRITVEEKINKEGHFHPLKRQKGPESFQTRGSTNIKMGPSIHRWKINKFRNRLCATESYYPHWSTWIFQFLGKIFSSHTTAGLDRKMSLFDALHPGKGTNMGGHFFLWKKNIFEPKTMPMC